MFAEAVGFILGNLLEDVLHFLVAWLMTIFEQGREIIEDPLHNLNVLLITFNRELTPTRINPDVEHGFEVLQILVVESKEGF